MKLDLSASGKSEANLSTCFRKPNVKVRNFFAHIFFSINIFSKLESFGYLQIKMLNCSTKTTFYESYKPSLLFT